MKHSEKAVDRLLQIGEEIRSGRRNARNALAEVSAIAEAGRIAFAHSNHQRFQKRTIKVKFFDGEVLNPLNEFLGSDTTVTGTLTVKDGKKSKKIKVEG